MNKFHYKIYYALLWLFTLLPLWLLYILADLVFLFMRFVLPYRKKVVYGNINKAFPEKDNKEVKKIANSFYRYFVDFMIESVKGINLPIPVLKRRYRVLNPEVINEQYDKGNNVVLVSGHYGNWEWMGSLSLYIKHKYFFAVKELNNKFSDKIVNDIRQQWGGHMVRMEDTYRKVIRETGNGEKVLIWLLADQRPPKNTGYWTEFLNQDTAFFQGAGSLVKKLGFSMVFLDIQRVKRGRYEMTFELLHEGKSELTVDEVTELHVRRLEKVIKNKPEHWLWSHKRWKHKRPTA